MATRQNYPLVAFAVIFSGLLIPLTKDTGILNYIPEFVTDYHLSLFTFISIVCGLFLLDRKYNRYILLFATPLLFWALTGAIVIYENGYMLAFSNYFWLWMAIVVYAYRNNYKKDLWLKPHQWMGLEILTASAFIILGNQNIGAINELINTTAIDHIWWAMFIGIFGILLLTKTNIRLAKTVLILSFPLIIQYVYVALYLLLIGESKAAIPLLLLRLYYIGKASEDYYDAF